MKSFKNFISEDIELMSRPYVPDLSGMSHFDPKFYFLDISSNYTGMKNPEKTHTDLGDFGKDYRLHRFTYSDKDPRGNAVDQHRYIVVHTPTNRVATSANMDAYTDSRFPDRKMLTAKEIKTHPDFRFRKTGRRISNDLYKHLSNLGHPIQSSSLQSEHGANIWNKLRKDPEVAERMMLHNPNGRGQRLSPAKDLHDSEIWTREDSGKQHYYPLKIDAYQDLSDGNEFGRRMLRTLVLLPPGVQPTK